MKITDYIKLWLLSFFAFSVIGCDQELAQQTEETEAKPQWNWDNYEQNYELELGSKRVNIQPKRSVDITAKSSGKLEILVNTAINEVEEDFLFAQIDKEKLESELIKIEIAKRAEEREDTQYEEFERPQKMKETRLRLKEAEIDLKRIKAVMNSKVLREEAVTAFGSEYAEVGQKALKEAEEELDLAKRQFELAEEYDPGEHADKQELSRIEREEREKSYDERKETSEYRVPFSGELRIELDEFVEGKKEYLAKGGGVIASINDYEDMHVNLTILGESWVSLEPSTLYLKLENADKTVVNFRDTKTLKNKATRSDEKIYIFAIPTAEQPSLKRLSGTGMEARLITRLPEKCWIVPKVDIALEALGKSTSKSWSNMVEDIWAGAKLVAEGENSLAIDYQPALEVELTVPVAAGVSTESADLDEEDETKAQLPRERDAKDAVEIVNEAFKVSEEPASK